MMRNRLNKGSGPKMSDFSAALLQAESRQQSVPASSYEQSLQSMLDEKAPASVAGNANLSEVLNEIRDHGTANTARDRNAQQDVVTDFSTAAETSVHGKKGRDKTEPAAAAALRQAGIAPVVRLTALRQHLPVVLLVLAVLALMVMQYRSDERLQQLVSRYQYSHEGGRDSLTAAMRNQHQLEQIQTKLEALTGKVQQLAAAPVTAQENRELARTVQQLLQQQQINSKKFEALQASLGALQAPLSTGAESSNVESRFAETRHQQGASRGNSSIDKAQPAEKRIHGRWLVNLASLSNRQKARQALQRLQGSGYQPMIEEIELKGKRIYRLSVAGFTSRKQASQFVKQARKYGFDKGWIRKG